MKILIYDCLPDEAKQIRQRVFVEEQGFCNEIDEIDNVAEHFVVYMDEAMPVATCRVFWDGVIKGYVVGRFAVYKEYRGKKIGSAMMKEAEKHVQEIGGKCIVLHAQCQVSEFYRKLGYAEYGEVENIEGCPHVWMKKELY